MRKLYQRLALVLGMSAVMTVLIFTVSLYGRSRAENIHYLRQLLDGVEENLSHNSEDYRERLELLEEDYLKRARAAEYILSSGPGLVSEEASDHKRAHGSPRGHCHRKFRRDPDEHRRPDGG